MINDLDALVKYDPRFLSNIFLKKIDLRNKSLDNLYDNYFSDHLIKHTNSGILCDIQLTRNNELFYYVEKNADYFKEIKELFPVFYKSLLPFYFCWDENSLLCLNDSWSSLGWIDIIHKKKLQDTEEIALIHFDSHQDMANPLIGINRHTGEYFDLLRGAPISKEKLFDFFVAIAIGSIGISNYISILPMFFKKVNVFYINQFKGCFKKYRYKVDFIEDSVFSARYPNILRMKNIYGDLERGTDYPHTRFESRSIEEVIEHIPSNANILLHFDMDYFNNFLDGSAEKYRKTENLRSTEEQSNQIKTVSDILGSISKNIIHTSIGLSPGFFPSKYWGSSTKNLVSALNNQGISVSPKKTFPNFDII